MFLNVLLLSGISKYFFPKSLSPYSGFAILDPSGYLNSISLR